ncbi:MAG: type I-C CRISPR-associated protein Cas7/Csd2 [Lactimicrobium massiliense]|nr:type I-C CRISPR-associated protein Cas7/Csd2 [Lactimicrobium massiliense]MDD6559976.1 type I-C CRISPR-associated protein Cas7/Csd2 [Lactimicrobium massiliense]
MSEAIKNRYDFLAIIDVRNGNPNGDPDADNMPRIDAETGLGYITDVCLKRKVRNFVSLVKAGDPNYRMYIQRGITLNAIDNEAFEKVAGIKDAVNDKKLKTTLAKSGHTDTEVKDYMCEHFYDVRTFGAVITTFTKGALNYGQLRGPVQFNFANSVDPVIPTEVTITRMAITKESDAQGGENSNGKQNEMGHKYIIPYGLYVATGHVSANLAKQTGFSEDDLQLLWQGILHMFDDDHAAARGEMSTRKLYVFKHDSMLGNAPAYKLFELVNVKKNEDVEAPRRFADYTVSFDREHLPEGVSATEME